MRQRCTAPLPPCINTHAADARRAGCAKQQCAQRGPAIKPRTGDAILFWSMNLEGKVDHSSMHASCPVIRGEKWTATKWCVHCLTVQCVE